MKPETRRRVLSLLYVLLLDLCLLLLMVLIGIPFAIEGWAVVNGFLLIVAMANRALDLALWKLE